MSQLWIPTRNLKQVIILIIVLFFLGLNLFFDLLFCRSFIIFLPIHDRYRFLAHLQECLSNGICLVFTTLSSSLVALLLAGALRIAGLETAEPARIALLERIRADGGVGIGVHFLEIISSNTSVNVAAELALVVFFILLELAHVVGYMPTEDVFTLDFVVNLELSLFVYTRSRETPVAVRNINTSIASTLKSAKQTGSSCRTRETDVEEGGEGVLARLLVVLHVELAIEILVAPFFRIQFSTDFPIVVELKLAVHTAS
mmetsp:Transcript_5285/g.12853  ORF Transcript_5285/g.12853 Transcript_5285/m.12853 type:complete len:258 (+) Transcript_5285:36-809(+)